MTGRMDLAVLKRQRHSFPVSHAKDGGTHDLPGTKDQGTELLWNQQTDGMLLS